MKVYLLTTGDGSDGNEWNVNSIHTTYNGASSAKRKYQKAIKRHDGSFYTRDCQIETWEAEK